MRRFINSVSTLLLAASIFMPAICFAKSLPGELLDEAIHDDFFTFFHLEEKKSDAHENIVTHYFQPEWRSDVLINVDCDNSGKILQMAMIVSREFIDDPKTNPFARDIVKSFINAATPPGNVSETQDLANEILLRNEKLQDSHADHVISDGKVDPSGTNLLKIGDGKIKKGDVALKMSGSLPKLQPAISNEYRVFIGTNDKCERALKNAHLIMKNQLGTKGRFLEIRIESDGSGRSKRADTINPEPNSPVTEVTGTGRYMQ